MKKTSNAQLESALKLGREYLSEKRAARNPAKVEYSVREYTVTRCLVDRFTKTSGGSARLETIGDFNDGAEAKRICALLNGEAEEKGVLCAKPAEEKGQ